MPRKIKNEDFKQVAEHICDTHTTRKKKRGDLEKQWKDIDRQLELKPDKSYKLSPNGTAIPENAWMPETELPLQSEALEMLTSDVKRLLFSDGPWFDVHSFASDELFRRYEGTNLIAGEIDLPSKITQDNIDKIVQGVVLNWHSQYDFMGHMDLITAESIKYGVGVGRGRVVKKTTYKETAKGVVKDDSKIPALIPRSIKNTYLDDTEHNLMNEGFILGPTVIFETFIKLADLKEAAKGEGWIPEALKGLEPDKQGQVQLLEMEGDITIPRKSTSDIFAPNMIVTVVKGSKTSVVRMRANQFKSSYILFPYHREHIDNVYSTSPLRKGWSIQKIAVEGLNNYLMTAALHARPPVKYSPDDPYYAVNGGPNLFPGAKIPSTGDVDPIFVGDPKALFQAYLDQLKHYADTVGTTPARLGAQTVSHTTRFAKQAELNRGESRTVDFARSCYSPLEQWLYMCYEMGRGIITPGPMFIESYEGYVNIRKELMPETVFFKVNGSGGPQEEQQKNASKITSMQLAVQLDQVKAQYLQQGLTPTVNIDAAIQQVLRDGGWRDVDAITNRSETIPSGTTGTQVGQAPGLLTEGIIEQLQGGL